MPPRRCAQRCWAPRWPRSCIPPTSTAAHSAQPCRWPTWSRWRGRPGVPVIVDAAYLSFPTALISDLVGSGADLVCFSAKYFYGPNAGGFLAGRTDLIEAVTDPDFTGYESGATSRSAGRPFKMDRTTIVATVLALQEWLTMDHDARWASYGRRVLALQAALADLPGLHARPAQFTLDERLIDAAPNALVLRPGSAAAATAMEDALATGTPRLLCVREGEELVVCVETVREATTRRWPSGCGRPRRGCRERRRRPAPERSSTASRVATALREELLAGLHAPGTPMRDVGAGGARGRRGHDARGPGRVGPPWTARPRPAHRGMEVARLDAADVRDIYAARLVIEQAGLVRLRATGTTAFAPSWTPRPTWPTPRTARTAAAPWRPTPASTTSSRERPAASGWPARTRRRCSSCGSCCRSPTGPTPPSTARPPPTGHWRSRCATGTRRRPARHWRLIWTRPGNGSAPSSAPRSHRERAQTPGTLTEDRIRQAVDPAAALAAVRQGFIALHEDRVTLPAILDFEFPEHHGEAHVKGAHIHGADHWVVKAAAGFFDNPEAGLPAGSGVSLVFSASTGFSDCVLLDNGYLTDLRTAAAGALSIELLARQDAGHALIVGAGVQARLQLQALLGVRTPQDVTVFARRPQEAVRYAEEMTALLGVPVQVADDLDGRRAVPISS